MINREQRNFQFDFLRPQHSLFQYFTKLLEQYTKVLIPPKDLQLKLDNEAVDSGLVLEQVNYRVAWLKHQEANRRRQEEALERERVLLVSLVVSLLARLSTALSMAENCQLHLAL